MYEEIWNETDTWFRDDLQMYRVADVIIDRLADDRRQEECRLLCRLSWHFRMGYQEVSYAELEQNISESKLAILNVLFKSIAAHDFQGIDNWADRCDTELPVVEDRSAEMYDE